MPPPPKMFTSQSLEPMTMLIYKAKGVRQMLLGIMGEPNVNRRVLISGRQRVIERRCEKGKERKHRLE